MPEHRTKVLEISGNRYFAKCSCSWRSEPTALAATARMAANDHEFAPEGEPAAARKTK